MRHWFLLAVSVCANAVACNETGETVPASAGQSANTAGQGGSAGTATDPPVRGGRAGVGGAAGAAGANTVAASSAGGASAGAGRAGAGPVVTSDGGLTSISLSPLPLMPEFSGSISDYYVRCAAGENQLTLTTTSASGDATRDVTLSPDQLLSVDDQYWIRCLPPDFPALTVTQKGTPTPGYYLVNSNTYGIVFDTNGVPVWYARGTSALNMGSPAVDTLSVMLNFAAQFGSSTISNFEVRDLSTDLVTVVTAASGVQTDGHEFQTLPNGDHLLFATPVQPGFDLTGLQAFGPDLSILGCEIEELDPAGNLVWSWNASDHIDPVQESLEPLAETQGGISLVDVYHCNAIEPDASGNLLLSARHTNSLFYIDRATGQVEWKLGGSSYSKDGAALIHVENDTQTTFSMQHDARFRPNGNITLFDDHGGSAGVARGIEYAIDHASGVATPVFQFLGIGQSAYEGSFRRYADGESVIGWGKVAGDTRAVTEVDSDGNDVFDIAFDDGEITYRAIKVPLTQLDIAKLRASTAN